MSFELRLLVVTLSVFAWTSMAVSPLVPLVFRRLRIAAPSSYALALTRLRWVPVAFAVAAAMVTLVSFYFFESRQPTEAVGLVLQAFALLSAAMWLIPVVRGVRALVLTRRLARDWAVTATPVSLPDISVPAFAIDHEFPMVAVVGVRRPRLFVARSVLDACSPAELRAILAHEQQHIDAGDNLRRTLLSITPDLLGWLPFSRRLRNAWHEASEEAADDAAARLGEDGRVLLAEALIRVARLGTTGAPTRSLPASALYRGENLDHRVRRLLRPRPEPVLAAISPVRRASFWIAAIVASALALQAVHVILEMAVTYLP